MGRGKLKLEFIANEKARKTTFQKRKKGIMKKAYEFSVLCGIDVCLFVAGPKLDGEDGATPNAEIETWPPERDAVVKIVTKYRAAAARKPPRRVCGLTDVLADRKRKIDAEIAQCRKRICAAKFPDASELLGRFSPEELAGLAAKLDGKIAAVKLAIGEKKKKEIEDCEEAGQSVVKDDHSGNGTVVCDNVVGDGFSYGPAVVSGGMGTVGLWGPVYEDQTVQGVLMDGWNGIGNHHPQQYDHYHHQMMMFGGGTSGHSSYLPVPLQVQPMVPYVPYQYPMNVVNVGLRIGEISQVIRTACEGNSELCSVVNGFMHNKMG